jgi:Uma2 family endonuclease
MAVAPKTVPTELLTYEQYMAAFGTEPPTTQPYEILDGIVYMVQTPTWRHQRIAGKIYRHFSRFEEQSGKGLAGIAPFDVVIRRAPKLRTRQPDVFFISHERLARNSEVLVSGPLLVAPELVVEVLSPSETPRMIRGKIEDFRTIGVQECWVVAPDAETVQVLRLTPEDTETAATYAYGQTVQSIVFPDLAVPVADIFAD